MAKKPAEKKTIKSVPLDSDTLLRVQKLAEAQDRPESAMLRILIKKGLRSMSRAPR